MNLIQKVLKAEGHTAWLYFLMMVAVLIGLSALPSWLISNAVVFTVAVMVVWYATLPSLFGGFFQSLLGGENASKPKASAARESKGGDTEV